MEIAEVIERLNHCTAKGFGLAEKETAAILKDFTEPSFYTVPELSVAVTGLLSYSLGVAFGLCDIRYATGEKAAPELPDPFAPLPNCPPGQLQNPKGLPARPEDVPATYFVRIPWDGILVDDPNHPLDL